MAKKPQTEESSLRILSIAYATGRLDRNTYLKLRTQQLGALDFDKPAPPLPEELESIEVPKIKIDASYIGQKPRRSKTPIIIILLVVLIAGAGAAAWYTGMFSSDKPSQSSAIKQPEPKDIALKLINKGEWSERDLKIFLRLWGTRSAETKTVKRNEAWYLSLENEVIKRINQCRLQLNTAVDPVAKQRELDMLERFYGKISSD